MKKDNKNKAHDEKENTKEFRQDLSQSQRPGMAFMIELLMKEPVKMPEKEHMTAIMKKHLLDVECFTYSEECAGFAARKYGVGPKEGKIPTQLMITGCTEFDESRIEDFERSQMWNCENSEQILKDCQYHVLATDMLAAGLLARERAELDMDFLEAVVELYPECEGYIFQAVESCLQ